MEFSELIGNHLVDEFVVLWYRRRVVLKWKPRHRLQPGPVTFVFVSRPTEPGGRRASDVERWPLFVWPLLPDISTTWKLSKMRNTQPFHCCLLFRNLILCDCTLRSLLAWSYPRTKQIGIEANIDQSCQMFLSVIMKIEEDRSVHKHRQSKWLFIVL